jgi:ribosomal protein S27E
MRTRALGLEIECLKCKARSVFHRAKFPRIDSSGFETYSFRCQNCGATLVGIIDPFDGKLLLSVDAESTVKAGPDHQKVDR